MTTLPFAEFLSCAAPLVWAKVLTIFDLLQFFGTLQSQSPSRLLNE